MPLHTEPQSWGLARSVTDEVGVQVAVLALEELGLETGEGAADPQVKLLSGVHTEKEAFLTLQILAKFPQIDQFMTLI